MRLCGIGSSSRGDRGRGGEGGSAMANESSVGSSCRKAIWAVCQMVASINLVAPHHHGLPLFIIPKVDPLVLPCWVNNFQQLNTNTIIGSHPLPWVDNILNNCAKGKIWAMIDMADSFFQTCMHPEDVYLTAVSTLF